MEINSAQYRHTSRYTQKERQTESNRDRQRVTKREGDRQTKRVKGERERKRENGIWFP